MSFDKGYDAALADVCRLFTEKVQHAQANTTAALQTRQAVEAANGWHTPAHAEADRAVIRGLQSQGMWLAAHDLVFKMQIDRREVRA